MNLKPSIKELDQALERERLRDNQKALTRHISLTDNDYDIAKALGSGNASQGIKDALRLAIKLNQIGHDEL